MSDGPVATIIRKKLEAAFSPERLELTDDSWKHAGHHHDGGIDGQDGGESHFTLVVVSHAFDGLNRVARQRAVTGVLKEELAGPVHALSIQAMTPEEA